MSDVDPLVAFIRARLADEERDAQAATQGPWEAARHFVFVDGDTLIYDEIGASGQTEEDCRHIARQDPAATLARVEAIRGLVDEMQLTATDGDCNVDYAGDQALRHVAAIWAWHPDYQQEWRP